MLLSSHILSEVEALCDRVTIIRNGRAAESGTFAELRHLTRTTVVVETARPAAEARRRLPRVHDAQQSRATRRGSVSMPAEINAVLEHARALRRAVARRARPPTLEELFLRHYGDRARPAAGARGGVSRDAHAHGRRLHRHRAPDPPGACAATGSPSPPGGSGLGLFVAATTACSSDSLAVHADLVRETRLVATNAGMRLLGLTSGPSVGGYMLHREYVTLAVLAALMSTFAVDPAHPPERGARSRRDARLDGGRTVRRPGRGRPGRRRRRTSCWPSCSRWRSSSTGSPSRARCWPAPRWPPSGWSGSASRR